MSSGRVVWKYLAVRDQQSFLMRPILLGPFGSMGILNMKLRIICIEDMILESILFVFALIRIATANTSYELWGA